jgi:hypothetical protein
MNNMSSIQPVLKLLFKSIRPVKCILKKHRIIFWYDTNGEMRDVHCFLHFTPVRFIRYFQPRYD